MNPIVGIGELLWDIYPDGRKVIGGAPFNFAFHCHQLGHEAVIVSRVGNDDLGHELREEVKRLGMSDEFIQTDRDHPTGTVRVTLDEQGHPSYEIVKEVAWDYIEFDEKLEQFSRGASVCCFGTLASRGETSRTTIRNFINGTNALCVFDVNIRKPFTWDQHNMILNAGQLCDWLKMTPEEISESMYGPAGVIQPDDVDFCPIRHFLVFGTEMHKVGILTRGSRSTGIYDWQRAEWIPAVHADVIDTVGAGDAFTAAMVVMHLEGKQLKDCARFAGHYAAKVCEHRGATPQIDRSEIEKVVFRV